MDSLFIWLGGAWSNLEAYLNVNPIVLTLVSILLGFGISEGYRAIRERLSIRRELKANQEIRLDGKDWIALWQAAADGDQVLNFENIIISQSGSQIWMSNKEKSIENPKGGYRWMGKLEFAHGETLMGSYYPNAEENSTSRGIMYFTYDAPRKIFLGRWVGKAIDGPFCSGFVVISKSREQSKSNLAALMDRAGKHPVNIVSMDFLKASQAA